MKIKSIAGRIILVTSFLFFISVNNTFAAGGVKAGLYFPSGMTVGGFETIDFDTSTAMTVGLDYDFTISDSFLIRPGIDYSSFANGADDGVKLIDIGLDILYIANIGNYVVRPYAGIAYGIGEFFVGSPSVAGSVTRGWVTEETNEFLVTRVGVEVDISQFYLDIGLRDYSGGNEEDVWIHAGLVTRVGFRFK